MPNGKSIITLNLDIPVPGNYSLGVEAGSNLYRNNSGASYPYAINNLISINGSNSTSNPAIYYYYLYDWSVQETGCQSPLADVDINVYGRPVSQFAFSNNGLSYSFSDNSSGNPNAWLWNFDDGNTSAVQNPTHTYVADGNYLVTLTVSNPGCSDSSSKLLDISTGLQSIDSPEWKVFPSVTADLIEIIRTEKTFAHMVCELIDQAGRTVRTVASENARVILDVREIAAGSYLLKVRTNGKEKVFRQIIAR